LVVLATVLGLVQSLFWTARVPLAIKLVTAGLGALAVVRPDRALLVLAALVPFTVVLTSRVWMVYPLAWAEALVLAWFAGFLAGARRRSPTHATRADDLAVAAGAFAAVVIGAAAVQFVVVQTWHDYPLAYARFFLHYLVRAYLTSVPDPRPWVEGQGFVTTAALLLEGLGLLLAARGLSRTHPGLAARLLRTVVFAGAGAALFNLVDAARAALGGQAAPAGLLVGDERWTAFIASLNTSGPYFVLVAFVALGRALAGPRRLPAATAALLAVGAAWLTKTYTAVVAGLATAGAALLWWGALRLGVRARRRLLLAATAAAGTIVLVIIVANPLDLLAPRAYLSLHLRRLFAETALRMWASAPVFGVGLAQYELRFPEFSSAELLRFYARADAHDYFLWIAAEFGLVGLVTFVWLVGAALLRAWRRLAAHPGDPVFGGVCAGLAAFILTWLGGQPLSVPVVAYTFWIVLGVAASGPPADAGAHRHEPASRGGPTWRRVLLAVFVIGLLVSVPVRVRQALREIDFARVTYGLFDWETEGLGRRYRWSGPRATVFVRASARAVELPVRAGLDPARLGIDAFEVRIFVNHRRVGLVRLADDRWQQLRVPLVDDGGPERFWRIDLQVNPTWRPADILPGSTDRRRLGVKVGELVVIE